MRIFDIFALLGSTYAACESGWTFDGEDSCWMVAKHIMNFEGAKSFCEYWGATLGVPNTYIIDNVYRGWIQYQVWIGAELSGDKFVHISDGTTKFDGSWYDGQPDNFDNSENCVELSNAGYLHGFKFGPGYNDVECDKKRQTLCKKPCTGCKKDACPSGWSEQTWSEDGKTTCSKSFTTKKTWMGAECSCQKIGGHLARADSKERNNFYSYMLRRMGISTWIALKKNDEDQKWYTTKGSEQEVITQSYWCPGPPDNFGYPDGENCGEIRNFGTTGEDIVVNGGVKSGIDFMPAWNDAHCESKNNYICERPVESTGAPLPDACDSAENSAFCMQSQILTLIISLLAKYFMH